MYSPILMDNVENMKTDNLSLTLMLPNIANLLIYKDQWNNSTLMRKVIAAILRQGCYEEIYTGNKIEFQCNHHFLGFENCAIISLKLSGREFLSADEDNTALIFAKELENKKNILHFDSTLLSEANNVRYTDVAIRIVKSHNLADEDSTSEYSQIA